MWRRDRTGTVGVMPRIRPKPTYTLSDDIADLLQTTNEWMTISQIADRLSAIHQSIYKTVGRGLRFEHERRLNPVNGVIELRVPTRAYLWDEHAA